MLGKLRIAMSMSALLVACGSSDSTEATDATTALQALHATGMPPQAAARRDSLLRASSRLEDLQADSYGDHAHNGIADDDPDDSGWDWVVDPSSQAHSAAASPDNLYGTSGLALWAAAETAPGDRRHRAALLDALLGVERNPAIDSSPDFLFLILASEHLHNRIWAKLARERYDARLANSGGDAEALGASIRDARHAAGFDGLIAYDLAWLALGAIALDQLYPHAGYRDDFSQYVRMVVEDLNAPTPLFDDRDPHEVAYVYGLAWSMLVASWDPGSLTLYQELRERLVALQLPEGAWPYNADYPDAHLQATAHAVIAFELLGDRRHRSLAATHQATAWLVSQQADNGGWPFTATDEYPAVDAEIGLALYLTALHHAGLLPEGIALVRAPRSTRGAPQLVAPMATP